MCSGDGPLNDVSFSACIHEHCDRQSIGRSGSNSCAPSFLCPDPWHHDGGNGTGIVCPRAMPLIQFGCIFMAESSSIGLVDRRSLVMKPTFLFFYCQKAESHIKIRCCLLVFLPHLLLRARRWVSIVESLEYHTLGSFSCVI